MRHHHLLLVAVGCVGCALAACTPAEPRTAAEGPPAACPGPLIKTADHTYCVHPTEVSWSEAHRICDSMRGHLVAPSTADENAALTVMLGRARGYSGRLWFGLAEFEPRRWLWETGAAPTYGAWAPNEPNNAGNQGEYCAELLMPEGQWNDRACSDVGPYLCERNDAVGPTWSCTGLPIDLENTQYCLYSTAPKSWDDAHKICRSTGGTLATPTSPEAMAKLRRALTPDLVANRLWLGISDLRQEGVFESDSGGALPSGVFMPGEPNDQNGEDCVELVVDAGGWNDLPCDALRPSLCELPR
ncbi:MAG: C-type lectin domain-containing protein [Polyangiaceae bacterium]